MVGTELERNSFKTVSGEILPDEGQLMWHCFLQDGRKCWLRGHVTDVHKPLISAGKVLGKDKVAILHSSGGSILSWNSTTGILISRACFFFHLFIFSFRFSSSTFFCRKKQKHTTFGHTSAPRQQQFDAVKGLNSPEGSRLPLWLKTKPSNWCAQLQWRIWVEHWALTLTCLAHRTETKWNGPWCAAWG